VVISDAGVAKAGILDRMLENNIRPILKNDVLELPRRILTRPYDKNYSFYST
jgi:hypothetical protein